MDSNLGQNVFYSNVFNIKSVFPLHDGQQTTDIHPIDENFIFIVLD